MKLRKKRRVGLLTGLLLIFQPGLSQSVVDSIPVARTDIYADSLRKVLDSLEVSLLKTTQSYQQIERLLGSLPPESIQLDSLPAVLPVELPIEQFRISSPFGIRRHPIHKRVGFHAGLDVKAPSGMIVKATAPGVISQVGYDPALGAFVRIRHAFGFETTYGHLAGYCVRAGQPVHRNEQLGKVGSTGLATGPHLHYCIKKNGSIVDPFQFCFLLRHRLWLYRVNSEAASGRSDSLPAKSVSSKGSYPNARN